MTPRLAMWMEKDPAELRKQYPKPIDLARVMLEGVGQVRSREEPYETAHFDLVNYKRLEVMAAQGDREAEQYIAYTRRPKKDQWQRWAAKSLIRDCAYMLEVVYGLQPTRNKPGKAGDGQCAADVIASINNPLVPAEGRVANIITETYD